MPCFLYVLSFQENIEFPRMFVAYSFHSPRFLIFSHARLCFVSVLYFLPCSEKIIFLSFHVTSFSFISVPPLSVHARNLHVLPLPVHVLSMSRHVMSKISQLEYSECVTVVTMVVTLHMLEYCEKEKYTHIQKHFLSCSCHSPFMFIHIPFMRFYFPVNFLSLPSMFPPFPSIIFLFYVDLV